MSEAAGRLEGVAAKLDRAREHVEAFQAEARVYLENKPYFVVRKFENHIPEKTGRSGLTWRIKLNAEPPIRLAVLAGDAVHNIRAALDHLAWQLVLANEGVPKAGPGGTQFPIRAPGNERRQPVVVRAKVGGISPEALAGIESLQPADRSDRLAVLNKLENIDKHRTLIVVANNTGRVVMATDSATTFARRRSVQDGTLVHWVLTDSERFDPDMQMHINYAPYIGLDEARTIGIHPTTPLDALLFDTLDEVRERVVKPLAVIGFGS